MERQAYCKAVKCPTERSERVERGFKSRNEKVRKKPKEWRKSMGCPKYESDGLLLHRTNVQRGVSTTSCRNGVDNSSQQIPRQDVVRRDGVTNI
jgi:hypothetical protein